MCVLAYMYVWESEEGIRSSEAGVRLLLVAMCVLEPWSSARTGSAYGLSGSLP